MRILIACDFRPKENLPSSFVYKKKGTMLLAYLQCESHIIKVLNSKKMNKSELAQLWKYLFVCRIRFEPG